MDKGRELLQTTKVDQTLKRNLNKVHNQWGKLLLGNLCDLRFQLLHLTNSGRRKIDVDASIIENKFKKHNFKYTVNR
jgi:hypothetical protein